MSASRFRTSHLALGLAGSVVAGAVVVAAIGRFIGFTRVGDTLAHADARWLAICVIGQTVVFAGYAAATRLAFAVDGGELMSVGASARLTLASFAATQVFAFAGVGGLALVYIVLRRAGRDRRSAAVTLIGLQTAVYMVFAVIALGGAATALVRSQAPLSMTLPWVIGAPLVFAAGRWFTSPARRERGVVRTGGAFRNALSTGIASAVWARERVSTRAGRRLLMWAALYWVGDLCSMWAALHAFGAQPALAALVAAYCAGYVVQALPIPLIATAGVDAATTLLLHVVGVPLDVALLGVVAHRIFAFWLPIVPGSLFAVSIARERTARVSV